MSGGIQRGIRPSIPPSGNACPAPPPPKPPKLRFNSLKSRSVLPAAADLWSGLAAAVSIIAAVAAAEARRRPPLPAPPLVLLFSAAEVAEAEAVEKLSAEEEDILCLESSKPEM